MTIQEMENDLAEIRSELTSELAETECELREAEMKIIELNGDLRTSEVRMMELESDLAIAVQTKNGMALKCLRDSEAARLKTYFADSHHVLALLSARLRTENQEDKAKQVEKLALENGHLFQLLDQLNDGVYREECSVELDQLNQPALAAHLSAGSSDSTALLDLHRMNRPRMQEDAAAAEAEALGQSCQYCRSPGIDNTAMRSNTALSARELCHSTQWRVAGDRQQRVMLVGELELSEPSTPRWSIEAQVTREQCSDHTPGLNCTIYCAQLHYYLTVLNCTTSLCSTALPSVDQALSSAPVH